VKNTSANLTLFSMGVPAYDPIVVEVKSENIFNVYESQNKFPGLDHDIFKEWIIKSSSLKNKKL
jgi:hypothetical protein